MPQSQSQSATIVEEQSSATPTRLSFSGLSGQRPLPQSPFRSSFTTQSTGSQDIDMDMSDEGEGVSDDESVDAETGRPSKKKKGQKFYCTDFPPCNLSFTRSEHLARHIRRFMSMKKSLETRWRLREPDSRGRFGPTGFEPQPVDREHQRPAVKAAMAEVTVVIYRLPASAPRLLP
ncbi:MAG: hypothetical protein Q9216_006766 [Gyalolechia sp. 2 TL-2023]